MVDVVPFFDVFETGSYYITQACLKPAVYLQGSLRLSVPSFLDPKCWDHSVVHHRGVGM